jgi:hypothetical protein
MLLRFGITFYTAFVIDTFNVVFLRNGGIYGNSKIIGQFTLLGTIGIGYIEGNLPI